MAKKVRAKTLGFYGCRRKPGDVFEVRDSLIIRKTSWLEEIPRAELKAAPKVQQPKADEDTSLA